jgi:hypothetical protein
MGHLSTYERNNVVCIYEELKTGLGIGNKCKKVSEIAKERGINISEAGVRLIIYKWINTGMFFL